jgi:hypothetical protein
MHWDVANSNDFICLTSIRASNDGEDGPSLLAMPAAERDDLLGITVLERAVVRSTTIEVAAAFREYDERWQTAVVPLPKKRKKKRKKRRGGKKDFISLLFEEEADGSGAEADHEEGFDSDDFSETEEGFVVPDHESESGSGSESESESECESGGEDFYDKAPAKRSRKMRDCHSGDEDEDEDEGVNDIDIIKDIMARMVMEIVTVNGEGKKKQKKLVVVNSDEEVEFA